ncbi:MAG: YkvA family protein [bacterium]|nr:YkvA family protein [bacterium]
MRRVERGFWPKLRRWAGRLPFVRDAVALYHCMRDPLTPFWVKAAAAGALSYFISPVDMAPDLIPVLGFLDDAAVLAAVVWTVRSSLTEAHFARADEWLGGMGPAAPADDR